MGFFSELYRELDLYSISFPLRYKKEKEFKTNFGSIFGILSFILFFIIFILFYRSIITYSNFTLVESTLMDSNDEYDLKDVPIIIGLIGKNGDFLEYDPKLYSFSLLYVHEYHNATLTKYHNIEIIPLNLCDNDTNYNKYKNYFKENIYSNKQLCASYNKTLVIKGKYGDNNYSYLNFEMNICNENINDCYSKEDIYNKLYGSSIVFGYLENIIDNYDYHKPIKLKRRAHFFPINPFLSKNYQISFSKVTYISDDGIIFQNNTIFTFYEYSNLYFDFETNTMNNTNKTNQLFTLSLLSTENSIIYKRYYFKFKDILADLSTWIKLLYQIFEIILTFFIKKMQILDIINTVYFNSTKHQSLKYKHKMNSTHNEKKYSSSKSFILFSNNRKKLSINSINNSSKKIEVYKKNKSTIINNNHINNYWYQFWHQKFNSFSIKTKEYFIPIWMIKKNTNLYFMRKLIEEIYLNISIETIDINMKKLKIFFSKNIGKTITNSNKF